MYIMEYYTAIKNNKAYIESCLRCLINLRVFCSSDDQLSIHDVLDTLVPGIKIRKY